MKQLVFLTEWSLCKRLLSRDDPMVWSESRFGMNFGVQVFTRMGSCHSVSCISSGMIMHAGTIRFYILSACSFPPPLPFLASQALSLD